MTIEKDDDHGRSQAEAQARSVSAMVAALECDFDRLEELRTERGAADSAEAWAAAEPADAAELAELEEAAGDCDSQEAAQEAIQNDPLSVEVRSDWHGPGEAGDAVEFQILLCTGGPAVRIMGELGDHNQPTRAWLEYQDWFTPWTEYHGESVDAEKLLTYCQQFYFGE